MSVKSKLEESLAKQEKILSDLEKNVDGSSIHQLLSADRIRKVKLNITILKRSLGIDAGELDVSFKNQ